MSGPVRIVALLTLATVLAACGSPAPAAPTTSSAAPTVAAAAPTVVAAASTAVAAAAPTAASGSAPTQVVTGIAGDQITVPLMVTRIAEQFPAHTITDLMLGAGPRLVAIPLNVKSIPFLRKVFPPIADVPELFQSGGSVNMEDLLKLKPDIVSTVDNAATLKPLQTVGLPAIYLGFNTYPQLVQSISLSGQVYGGSAKQRADDYNTYFNAKLDMVQSRIATVPADQRPSVVHIASYPPLIIDGGASLIGTWIALAGGTDVANGLPGAGTHATVTMEQLLSWNPEAIIVETPGGDQGLAADTGQSVINELAKSTLWQSLQAVQSKRVYVNPQGLYPWDRFGPEEALQIQWAAKTLHPDLFTDLDMRATTRSFYQTFFDYNPTEADLDQILAVGP